MLDTNMCSYIGQGNPVRPREVFEAVGIENIAISVVVRAELLRGLSLGGRATSLIEGTQEFLIAVPSLDLTAAVADRFAQLWDALRRAGSLVPDMDLLIAAHAVEASAILVTNKVKHFGRLAPDLKIENWVEPVRP
jgi:tRNA(fMet)-specific endonuclease VapC